MYIERFTQEMQLPSCELSCESKYISGSCGVHSHEFYEIELVLSGAGEYTVDGKVYEIRRGALLFMSPASFHSVSFSEETALINIMFDANMCNASLLYNLFRDKSHIWEYADDENIAFFETVCRELTNVLKNSKEASLFSKALLDSIVGKVFCMSGVESGSEFADPIQKAVIYLHSNFTCQVTLEEVAVVSGYSASYFSERFRRYVGDTFRSYLANLRFSHAEKLLKYTNMSVTEICYECGFNNYTHFTKTFKARYKTTPAVYRRQRGVL